MILVNQALEALSQQELSQANLHALPISIVGQYFAVSKGAKDVEPENFNPVGAHLYKQEAKEQINPVAATTFLELSAAQLIPAWVINQIDVKLMRAAAK